MATYGGFPTAVSATQTRSTTGTTTFYTCPAGQYAKLNVDILTTFTSGTNLDAGFQVNGVNVKRITLTSAGVDRSTLTSVAVGPGQTVGVTVSLTGPTVGSCVVTITGYSLG